MAGQTQLNETTLVDFAKRHKVSESAIFGSALRDDFTSESDVDILVTFLPGAKVSLFDLVDMGDELSRWLPAPPAAGAPSHFSKIMWPLGPCGEA